MLEGLRGEASIAELCRKEGIGQNLYYRWSKEFLEAGKKRLAGDTAREATSDEVKTLRSEARQLKEALADQRFRCSFFLLLMLVPFAALGLLDLFTRNDRRCAVDWLCGRLRACGRSVRSGVTCWKRHIDCVIILFVFAFCGHHHLHWHRKSNGSAQASFHSTDMRGN